jgi:hypothetical protein
MEKDVIYLTGLDRKSQHVVGLIAKDDGPGGPVFVKRTILQLPRLGCFHIEEPRFFGEITQA